MPLPIISALDYPAWHKRRQTVFYEAVRCGKLSFCRIGLPNSSDVRIAVFGDSGNLADSITIVGNGGSLIIAASDSASHGRPNAFIASRGVPPSWPNSAARTLTEIPSPHPHVKPSAFR
jgi:hypothetical protein